VKFDKQLFDVIYQRGVDHYYSSKVFCHHQFFVEIIFFIKFCFKDKGLFCKEAIN